MTKTIVTAGTLALAVAMIPVAPASGAVAGASRPQTSAARLSIAGEGVLSIASRAGLAAIGAAPRDDDSDSGDGGEGDDGGNDDDDESEA